MESALLGDPPRSQENYSILKVMQVAGKRPVLGVPSRSGLLIRFACAERSRNLQRNTWSSCGFVVAVS